MSEHTRW